MITEIVPSQSNFAVILAEESIRRSLSIAYAYVALPRETVSGLDQ